MSFFSVGRLISTGIFIIFFTILSSCNETVEIKEGYDFAFTGVNVISLKEDTEILFDQTVLIKDGLIKSISPSKNVIVAETTPQVDGGGTAYLMPGLVDSHTHINKENDLFLMPLFLTNGVTTIFNMSGTRETLKIRDQVASGEVLGPTIYTAGPMFQLPGVTTPEDAERVFNEQVEAGYDFIKIYGDLRPEAHQAVGRLGKNTPGIAVVGHAPRNLPFESVLENEQTMLAHLEEIIYTKFNDRNLEEVPEFARQIAETSDLYITATLVTFSYIVEQWGRPDVVEKYLESERSIYLTPALLKEWTELNRYTNRDPEQVPTENLEFQKKVIFELYQAGVPLLSGTDTPLPMVYPGFSLLEELEIFHDAGIPEAEILKIASWNAGSFFREHVKADVFFGAVLPEYRADLLLLEKNPLEDLENLKNPAGVMVRGQWFSREDLTKMLETMALDIAALPAEEEAGFDIFPMDIEKLKTFTGRYIQEEPYTIVEWFLKDGELYNGEPDSEQKFRMIPVGETTFRFADIPVEMVAEFSENNSRFIMTMDGTVIGDFRLSEEE